jgi:hypothetical protein
MNPRLRLALLLTLAASGALALWPEADAPVEPVAAATRATASPANPASDARPAAPPAALPTADTPASRRHAPWPELSAAGRAAWAAHATPTPPGPGGPSASAPPASARSVAAVPAPAVASAPPLPWQWVGVYDDGQAVQALLAGRLRSVSLTAGQILERDWRLDAIENGQLRWTWLPGALPVVQQARLQVDTRPPRP